MNRVAAAVLLAVPLFLCACSSGPERYTCPHCSARLIKSGQSLAVDTSTTSASAVAAPSAIPQGSFATAQVYRIAPKAMIERVQQALTTSPLNLKVASSENGVIVTDWKEGYEGNFHIARRWEERTRFRVAVVPDVNDPANASRLEITEQTQERSNDKANWAANPSTSRPERVAEVAKTIEAKLR